MAQFYLRLWVFWAVRVSLCSIGLAALIALCITLYSYIVKGMVTLNGDVIRALGDIFFFWLRVTFNITLLFALFRSIKYIFNRCYHGYVLRLLECKKEKNSQSITRIGYGDLVAVWRRWFMLLIWIVGAMIVVVTVSIHFLSDMKSIFVWLNSYILYMFVLFAGYFSFLVLGGRCKAVRIEKC